MRTRLLVVLFMAFVHCPQPAAGIFPCPQRGDAAPQTVTLYPPLDKSTGKYDEARGCFSFKLGSNKLPDSADWDLGYGFASINNEDWLLISVSTDRRSVMKDLGRYNWSDRFVVPALDPLPMLKEGESRQIRVDASADTHKEWAR